MKMYALAEVEHVCLRIGYLPRIGQPGFQVEVLIAPHQRIEQQLSDSLRLSVKPNSRIEIGGAALDDHDDGVWIWLTRAGAASQQYDQYAKEARNPNPRMCSKVFGCHWRKTTRSSPYQE